MFLMGILLGMNSPVLFAQPNIVKAEFFFDSDPGFGQGINISITPGTQILDQSFSANTTTLTAGIHQLFIRVQDADGKWSITNRTFLYKSPDTSGTNLPHITKAEIFFDADPGFGLGLPVTLTPGIQILDADFSAIIDSLSLGEHHMYLRVQDADGKWSVTSYRIIRVCETNAAVAEFEIVKDNHNVSFVNNSLYAASYRWFFGDGDSSHIQSPYREYGPGNWNVKLIAANPCGIDTLIKTVTIEGVDNIYPNYGGNTGGVTAIIKGFGFTPATTVSITNGSNTLTIDSLKIINADKIVVRLNLIGATPGMYNLVVTIPGTPGNIILQNAFTVQQGMEPVVRGVLNAPPVIRAGRETQFFVSVFNDGNIDACGVPVIISGFPINTTIKVKLDSVPLSQFTFLNPSTADTSVNFVIKDSVMNEQYIAIILPVVVPGHPISIPISITSSQSEFSLEVSTFAPDFDYYDPVFDNRVNAAEDVLLCGSEALLSTAIVIAQDEFFNNIVEGLIAEELAIWRLCARNTYKFVKGIAKSALYQGDNGTISTGISLYRHLLNGTSALFYCSEAGLGLIPAGRFAKFARIMVKARKFFVTPLYKYGLNPDLKIYDYVKSISQNYNECQERRKELSNVQQYISVRQSYDPNIKVGSGSGSNNYLSNKERIGYSIFFENSPSAGLPAQTVVILDTINKQQFDISSLRFTSFAIGKNSFYLTDASQSFVRTIDLRPRLNLKVRVNGFVDTATGILRCEYQTIDVVTNQETTDSLAGFLLPNNADHEGEGGISYTIKPADTIMNGNEIKNRASIYFDFNTPVLTDYWTNRFDLIKPVSQVQSLQVQNPSDTIYIQINGSDNLSGISHYMLYAKEDSGQYALIRPYIPLNGRDTLIGKFGKTYHFYSKAVDTAGNIESEPGSEDASTTIYYETIPQIDFVQPYRGYLVTDSILFEYHFIQPLTAGNQYFVQMTDSTGEGSTFTNIFNFSDSNLNGIRKIPVPLNSPCAIGYRFRFISTETADTSEVSDSIRLFNAPPANLIIPANDTACIGQTIILKVENVIGASYQWYKDGIIITGATDTLLAVTTNGEYKVTVTTGTCYSSSASVNLVFINQVSAPTITNGSATTFCFGGNVTLTSSAASGNQWYKNGVAIIGSTNATLNVTTSGSYTVKVSVNGCESAASNAIIVTVNSIPTTPVITAATSATFCSGGSVTLTSNAASGNQWYKDGVAINGSTNATLNVTASGSYTVKVTISGCESAASNAIIVTVNSIPTTPVITAGTSATFCTGGSVTLTSNATSGNQWYKDGVAINGSTNATLNVTASGSYTVKVTVSGCESAASNAIDVVVNAIPSTPTVTQNGNELVSNATSGNQWYLNGNIITGAISQNYTPTVSGNYTVQVTINGCVSPSSNIFSFTVTSIPTINIFGNQVKIFPDPVRDRLIIIHSGTLSKLNIRLIDINGQLLKKLSSNLSRIEIDMSMYPAGAYIIWIEDARSKIQGQKILIKL